jgi:hypothetical protein
MVMICDMWIFTIENSGGVWSITVRYAGDISTNSVDRYHPRNAIIMRHT